jgi:hypothetical protein
MTSMFNFSERNRDQQDGVERHVWGKLEHFNTGATIKVRGNGTVDEEAIVLNTGVGYNYPENTNTEVFLLASGSDTNLKFALVTIPRDKQRPWAEGTGGIQHPTDPNRAMEFNSKRTWLEDGTYAFGRGGEIELKDGKLYVRADIYCNTIHAKNIIGPEPTPGDFDIPAFEK